MNQKFALMAVITLLLAACSSAPQRSDTTPPSSNNTGGYLAGDGPDANTPANIDDTPDAVPKAEPLHRYANRPYKALGKEYIPLTEVGKYKQRGIASWYGKKFHGQRTSIGETYDMYAMSAAHPTLPIPSYARVTNLSNKKSVIVRVNDRGPFMHDRIIDLSYTAAHKLGILGAGSAEVEVESLVPDTVTAPASPITVVQSTPMESPVVTTPLPAAIPASAVVTKHTAPPSEGKVYLQLGAFKNYGSAKQYMDKMQHKLGHSDQSLSLHHQGDMIRVRLGTYANADEAREAAVKLHGKLGVKPFISQQ